MILGTIEYKIERRYRMIKVPEKELNNGVSIPVLGLGVFKSGEDTYDAVRYALDCGYRHIDTAMIYGNEQDVGKAIKDSGISREEIFITTKLWTDDMRAKRVREAFEESLRLLGMEYVDMYLIHWPVKDEYINSYKVMEELNKEKKIRAIGVSNFLSHHIKKLIGETKIKPVVDQIEIHPYLNNNKEIEYLKNNNITPESWSPLARGRVLEDSDLKVLSEKYNKSVAQIVIKWHLAKGLIVIPKSVRQDKIIENIKVFDFKLSDEDIKAIDQLDRNMRTGSHPDTFKH